jgi:pyridoxal phosphate enzyme (YggS family)
MDLTSNIENVKKRIEIAAAKAGRDPDGIRLVAVTKRVETPRIIEAVNSGVDTFGENYAQELRDKAGIVRESTDSKVYWHFIGRLQKNKVKYLVGKVELIHSLDSLGAAEEIDKRAEKMGIRMPVLIEVGTGGEETKGGVSPGMLESFLAEVNGLKSLDVRGFMTMPPYFDDPESARPYFRELRELRDRYSSQYPGLSELSMGMSGDFEVAIEEGATLVRVGTSIFGLRDK